MADGIVSELLQRQQTLESERRNHDSHWQEIAELINPMRADFTVTRMPGEKRMQKIFDGTAGMAEENLASGLYGLMTNPANEWMHLRSSIDELNDDHQARLWLDDSTRRMRNAFAANGNRFYNRVIDYYADLVSFGPAVFYTAEFQQRGVLQFSCRHLAECYFAENSDERVDTLFRKFKYTARQAVQEWGNRVSKDVMKAAEKEPERLFGFLHAVMPNRDLKFERQDAAGMPFSSAYVDIEGQQLIGIGGYREFPYQVARWGKRSRSVYGDACGMLALPDTKMVNMMSKTTIVAAQKAVDPPILAPDEASIRGVRTTPGSLIYGGIDPVTGRRMYEPLQTGANIGLGLELEERRRQAIREAFFWSLLVMIQQPNMTATEFLGRQEEQIRLMGPHLGRIQTEFLDPLIDRVFMIMYRAGAFAPVPEVLQRYPDLRVEYVSPLARALKASEAGALLRAGEALTPIAAAKPEVWDNVDEDEYARAILDGFGVPAKITRDRRAVAELRQQRQAAQTAMALAQNAAPAAGALKDVAQAGAIIKQSQNSAQPMRKAA
jgi:hypothetical protein